MKQKSKTNYVITPSIYVIFIIAIMVCIGIGKEARADIITITASQDTFITEHANLGGSSSIHGTDDYLYLCRGTGTFRTFPLVKFDLSSSSDILTTDDAILHLELINAWGNVLGTTQTISIRELLVDWNESTTSFVSFGGTGFNETSQTGSNLFTRTITYNGYDEDIEFNIPSYIVQNWIDNPNLNYGLVLISNTTTNQRDISFSSREGLISPSLSYTTVPVPLPGSLFLLFSGFGCVAGFRNKIK